MSFQYTPDHEMPLFASAFGPDLDSNGNSIFQNSDPHISDVSFDSTAFDMDMNFDENISSDSDKTLEIGSNHAHEPNYSPNTTFGGDLNYDAYMELLGEFGTSSYPPEVLRSTISNRAPGMNSSIADSDTSFIEAGGRSSDSQNCFGTNERVFPDRLATVRSCLDGNYTCMVSAIATLKSLHISATACLTSTKQEPLSGFHQPRMTDIVFKANKDAVAVVSNILKCTCSLRPQIQIVLANICDKLIAWYRALIRSDHQSSKSEQKKAEQDHVEKVLFQPITIGSHSFHAAIESKIRAQVVLGDLQHLETLIETFLSRIEDVRDVKKVAEIWPGSVMPPDELARVIHENTSAYLCHRLQTAKAEIIALLN